MATVIILILCFLLAATYLKLEEAQDKVKELNQKNDELYERVKYLEDQFWKSEEINNKKL